ncbi:MAG: oxygen-independent coproporphyrinogen III oxidase [SAR324 cluster bacterium]|uniref:Coproporphyrinogen-III oxidase n=1 Tax=SAR324 cluster bacterium TaxID=2024889 RepID=A0A7X9FS11_9DELT|nr:oxygen-independent coproporphyrinogen III oxidase [SAR324 cluster bacterium]
MSDLFEKYDVAAPRYTSYPTVPYWENAPSEKEWIGDIEKALENTSLAWSAYLHLPFCESACSFCACNTIICHDHNVEASYVRAIQSEFLLYLDRAPELKNKPLRQIHIGGGTPTFFSSDNLQRILSPYYEKLDIDLDCIDASIEINPVFAKIEQLRALRSYGFDRLSIGVQDFNPEVQREINRSQPRHVTEALVYEARALGFKSINFDLIYGLPGQTQQNIKCSADTAIELKADRIALYSLALVPWIKPAHNELAKTAPKGREKRALYEVCRRAFLEAGYVEIGMDHFALPDDSLARASATKTLHRNFMGYTDFRSELIIAIGLSAISQSIGCYHQNTKDLDAYQKAVMSGRFATTRGHMMNDEDKARYKQILSLMTCFEVELESEEQEEDAKHFLSSLLTDGLLRIENRKLYLTEIGRPFLRNACMFFDERLRRKAPETRVFSQSL